MSSVLEHLIHRNTSKLEDLIHRNTSKLDNLQNVILNSRLQEKNQLIFERLKEQYALVSNLQDQYQVWNPPKLSLFDRFISDTLEKYRGDLHNSIETYNDPISLFVVGNGNYGKSTFINSLMGEAVAEANILPKTWKIDFYRANLPEDQVLIKYKDGSSEHVTVDEAKSRIATEEKLRKESEKLVKKMLDEFKESELDENKIKEKEEELHIYQLYHSPMVEAHWPVQNNQFSNNFYIVDTPGLNQKLHGIVKASIKDYYHKAGSVIWMLDATVLSSKTSAESIDQIRKVIADVGESKGDIIAILNRIDLIRGEENQQRIIEEATRLYGEFFSLIIPYSSKLAFEGKRDNDVQKLDVSRSKFLEKTLFDKFSNNKSERKVSSKEFTFHSSTKFLLTDSANFLKKFNEYQRELVADYNAFRSELKELNQETGNTLSQYLKITKSKLIQNVANWGDSFFDLTDETARDRYLREKLFEVDRLLEEINDMKDDYEIQLQLLEKRYLQKAVYTEFKYLDTHRGQVTENVPVANFSLNSSNYTSNSSEFNIGIGVAGAITAGAIFGPLGMVIGGLAGWAYKLVQKGKLRKELEEQTSSFTSKLSKDFRNHMKKRSNHIDLTIAANQFRSFSGLYDFNFFTNDEKFFTSNEERDEAFMKLDTFEANLVTWMEEVTKTAIYESSHPLHYIERGVATYGN